MASNLAPLPMPSYGKMHLSGVARGPLQDLITFDDPLMLQKAYQFVGDAVPAELDVTVNGTAAAVAAGTDGVGIDVGSATADNGHASVSLGLAWDGDRGVFADCIIDLPAAITTMKFEFGLTDDVDDIGAVLLKGDTPATVNAVDCAVFVFDTDDDANLAFVSAQGSTVVEDQDIEALAALDKLYMAVQIDGDNLRAWYSRNGGALIQITGPAPTGFGGGLAIQGGSALTPWVMSQVRAGSAARTITMRSFRCTGPIL